MFNKTTFLLSILTLYPLGAFADAPLLLNNQSFANGCTVTNIGAYSGSVNMVPVYQKISTNTSFTGACTIGNLGVSSGTVNAIPLFDRASYTCAAGYYLPADAIECVACLPGATCAGGTYTFNETSDQGLSCSGVMYRNACHARCNINQGRLHADQYSHPLFLDKTNIPSPVIHIRYDNGAMCYGYTEPGIAPPGEHGIHILFEGAVYHAVNPGE